MGCWFSRACGRVLSPLDSSRGTKNAIPRGSGSSDFPGQYRWCCAASAVFLQNKENKQQGDLTPDRVCGENQGR